MQNNIQSNFDLSKRSEHRRVECSIENQIVVVLEQIIGGHPATCRISHHRHAVGTFKVRLHQLVVAAIVEHHAAEFQAFDAQ